MIVLDQYCFCYKFNLIKLKWKESEVQCKMEGGNLISMETERKWEFINSKVQRIYFPPNEFHIGLKKVGQTWTWVINNQSLTKDKWQRGGGVSEPDGHGRCAAMSQHHPEGIFGLFKEITCSNEQLMSICEYKAERGKHALRVDVRAISSNLLLLLFLLLFLLLLLLLSKLVLSPLSFIFKYFFGRIHFFVVILF